jgi:catechol 2,3-dioxygenase-like lactoylglutathione lyase family enzyme
MAKLRHIAITVPDIEASAKFYEETFGMTRSMISPIGVLLTDGVVNLAILKFQNDKQAGDERGKDYHGLHHIGFVEDDLDGISQTIEQNGGKYHMRLPNTPEGATEVKFRDPNGVVFDIVDTGYASRAWGLNLEES